MPGRRPGKHREKHKDKHGEKHKDKHNEKDKDKHNEKHKDKLMFSPGVSKAGATLGVLYSLHCLRVHTPTVTMAQADVINVVLAQQSAKVINDTLVILFRTTKLSSFLVCPMVNILLNVYSVHQHKER